MPLFARSKRSKRPEGEVREPLASGEPVTARARTVGMLLREARQGYGRDVAQVGNALRIRPAYLQAIEEGRYDALPGPTYTVGFLRTYAEYLGLDGAEMVRRFKQETEGLRLRRDLTFPMPLTERSIPGGTILLFALILAICGYGLWYYLSSADRSRPERVGGVPSTLLAPPRSAATAPAIPAADVSRPIDASAAPQPAAPETPAAPASALVPTTPTPASSGRPSPATPPAVVASLPPVPPPSALPVDPAHVFGITNGPSRIVIHAISDSWIQVRDGDQKLVFTRVLRAGEIYRAPDKAGLIMRVGNAGGIEVVVDGKTAPSLGGVGVVRKSVLLDPQKLMAGEAVVE